MIRRPMRLRGLDADIEHLADIPVFPPFDQQLQNFPFARRQLRLRTWPASPAHSLKLGRVNDRPPNAR